MASGFTVGADRKHVAGGASASVCAHCPAAWRFCFSSAACGDAPACSFQTTGQLVFSGVYCDLFKQCFCALRVEFIPRHAAAGAGASASSEWHGEQVRRGSTHYLVVSCWRTFRAARCGMSGCVYRREESGSEHRSVWPEATSAEVSLSARYRGAVPRACRRSGARGDRPRHQSFNGPTAKLTARLFSAPATVPGRTPSPGGAVPVHAQEQLRIRALDTLRMGIGGAGLGTPTGTTG